VEDNMYKSIDNHCHFCEIPLKSAIDFYEHMLNRHFLTDLCLPRKKWSCMACVFLQKKKVVLFGSMEQLQNHINFCNDEKYNKGEFLDAHRFGFVCNLCKCGFGGRDESSNLSKHFISQHDNPYAIKSKLDPLITNKRKVDQAFNLDSRDSGNILIETNTKNLSVTITAFKCNVCLEVLPSLDELVKHSKICRGEKPFCNSGEKRFHCYECFKVFPTRGSLLEHKAEQHKAASKFSTSQFQ